MACARPAAEGGGCKEEVMRIWEVVVGDRGEDGRVNPEEQGCGGDSGLFRGSGILKR